MTSRRSFLAGIGTSGVCAAMFRGDALARASAAGKDSRDCPAEAIAENEDYWSEIQRCFDLDRSVINLNNGGVSPCPSHVMEQMVRDLKFSNEAPAIHMWNVLEPRAEAVRRDLAREFCCDPEELAITRNASEGMETLILGIDLKAGDEVIITDQNYPRMITTWDQRVRREGLVVKKVSFPIPLPGPETFVERIRAEITPRTRVIEFPHITHCSGQILPVREVVRLGREKGITVFVDGAHAFAHFPFRRDDLECDYYATSLHKWTLAPVGTGFLYVRKSKQKAIWPLMAAEPSMSENIRKFEEIGTHPAANHNAVATAVAFHRSIGTERKVARLRALRDRWAGALLAADPRVTVLTPLGPGAASAGIGLVHIKGTNPRDICDQLLNQHKIVTIPIVHPQFQGVRVTPNVYTTPGEIDVFVDAMKQAIKKAPQPV